MNVFDKNLLFDMSYALMRRFAFIEVTSPDEDAFEQLLHIPGGDTVRQLLTLRQFRDLGPAVYLDACRYANRRSNDDVTASRLLYEVFYGFFLPQFEGMDENRAGQLYKVVASALEPPEQAEAHRTIAEVLGVEMAL
jgi:hypothetical protein